MAHIKGGLLKSLLELDETLNITYMFIIIIEEKIHSCYGLSFFLGIFEVVSVSHLLCLTLCGIGIVGN